MAPAATGSRCCITPRRPRHSPSPRGTRLDRLPAARGPQTHERRHRPTPVDDISGMDSKSSPSTALLMSDEHLCLPGQLRWQAANRTLQPPLHLTERHGKTHLLRAIRTPHLGERPARLRGLRTTHPSSPTTPRPCHHCRIGAPDILRDNYYGSSTSLSSTTSKTRAGRAQIDFFFRRAFNHLLA